MNFNLYSTPSMYKLRAKFKINSKIHCKNLREKIEEERSGILLKIEFSIH